MPMNFERSPLTDSLVHILRAVNGEVSYETLAKQAKIDKARMKAVLPSARRILKGEKILFGCITNFGLRRLVDGDKVRKSEDNKKRMARAAGRAIRELGTIEAFDRLSNIDQLVVTTNRSIFNLARSQLMTRPEMRDPPPAMPQAPAVENLVRIGKK